MMAMLIFIYVNLFATHVLADADELCKGNGCLHALRTQDDTTKATMDIGDQEVLLPLHEVSLLQTQIVSTKSAMDDESDLDGESNETNAVHLKAKVDNRIVKKSGAVDATIDVITGAAGGADLCGAAHAMTLGYKGQPLANNLGNSGPESGEASLRFGHVFPSAEKPVDLVVVAEGGYTPKNSAVNGLANGVYGIVNIQTGTHVNLKYKFVDSATGEPVVTHKFMMTFYDFDTNIGGSAAESVTFSGFSDYTTADDTELSLFDHGDGSLTVAAEKYGNKSDNPISPLHLTDSMKKKAISITFPPLSEFAIVFKSTPSQKARPGGRNLMFGGPSSLECPDQPTCDSFECSSDMVQIPFAEFNNGADEKTCCNFKATCMTHTCSQGKILIAKALETDCAGIECASTDDEQCCVEQSPVCNSAQLKLHHPTVNNLGGQGPDSGTDHTLTFGNVFPDADVEVNLVISAVGSYVPKDSAKNGKHGKLGEINVKSGNDAGLRFSFVNAVTGDPETVPGFHFSIVDLDCGGSDGTVCEHVQVSGYSSYTVFDTTGVLAEPIDASSGIFYGTTVGDGSDDPKNLFELTDSQKRRLVSFEFLHTEEFDVTIGAPEGEGGRNFFFGGSSSFYCS